MSMEVIKWEYCAIDVKKQNVDFSFRDKWAHIEYSEKGFGKLGDYYLCPKCASDYHEFINNETVIGGEKWIA